MISDYYFRHRLFVFDLNNNSLAYLQTHPSWTVANWFRYRFDGINGFQSFSQLNIFYVFFNVFHPAYLFAGAVFIPFIRKADLVKKEVIICLSSMLLYALFLAGFDTQNMRFLLIPFPLVLIIFFPAYGRLLGYISKKRIIYFALSFALTFQIAFLSYSFSKVYAMNRADQKIVEVMKEYPDEIIYTFGIDGALKAYGLPNRIINVWYNKLDTIQPNSLVLLQVDDIERQFKDQNPGINWQILRKYGHLTLIKNLDSGWKLYKTNP
jgi:hypothetical protein